METEGKTGGCRRLKSSFELLNDRIMPHGVAEGQQVLVSGPPGIGKTTFLLQVMEGFARCGIRCIFATAEIQPSQLKERFDRLASPESGWPVEIIDLRDTDALLNIPVDPPGAALPQVLFVDSVQKLGVGAGVSAEWKAIFECLDLLRRRSVTAFFVCHATKGEDIAGPRRFEHEVDTVIRMNRLSSHRIFQITKNRFGPSIEEGVLCRTDSIGRLLPLPYSAVPLVTRAAAYDRHGVAWVEGKVEGGMTPGRFPPKPILNGIPKNAYGKILTILRGMDIDLGRSVVTSSLMASRRYAQEHDLAIAMSLIGSYLQSEVPWEPVFCAELALDGTLLPPSMPTMQHMLLEFQDENMPLQSRIVVMCPAAVDVAWRQLVQMPVLPVLLFDAKTLSDVVSEFLVPQGAPAGLLP